MLPLPSQEIKPYLLLPIPKQKLMNMLLLQTGLKSFNLFWLFLFVPFGIMTVTRFYGIGGVMGYAFGIWLLMVMNAYWSVMVRTLMRAHIFWLLLPILFYGRLLLFALFANGIVIATSMLLGAGLIRWNLMT